MVEAAVADVVGPAVAADDPDAPSHEHVGQAEQVAVGRGASFERRQELPSSRAFSAATRSRCACDARPRSSARRSSRPSTSSSPMVRRVAAEQLAAYSLLLVERQAEAEAELGVVLEERVRPGRAAALAVRRPGRGRQVAAVDRGAAGGVGDEHPVAEELGDQLDVGRLAAAGAGAGELEERLEELRVLDRDRG